MPTLSIAAVGRLLAVIAGVLAISLVVGAAAITVDSSSVPQASSGRWFNAAPMNHPRSEVGVGLLDGKIYVVGGFLAGRVPTNIVEVYDPATDRWEDRAPLPFIGTHVTVVGVDGKLYTLGGSLGTSLTDTTAAVYAYDPTTDQWSPQSPLPMARGAGAAAVIDGKIYFAGGLPVEREFDFTVYDPQTDNWEVLPPMPARRNHLAAAAINGLFYAVGGRTGPGVPNVVNTDALEVFDPTTRLWSTRAPLPKPRGSVASAVVNGCLYVFNGEMNPDSPTGVFADNDVYDPRTDRWESLEPVPIPVHGTGAVAIGNRIYIPGGGTRLGGGSAAPVHQVYETDRSCE
jgi:N-acetylneuraminic acid mutarotase